MQPCGDVDPRDAAARAVIRCCRWTPRLDSQATPPGGQGRTPGRGMLFMGQMRFVIPRPERLVAAATEQAYLAGAEGIPWECQVTLTGGALILERDTRESGYLHFPWKVPGRGQLQLSSGSLMERLKAYNLPVELARGTLNRLRNQACQWQLAGMTVPAAFDELVHVASLAFARAATGQEQPETAQDHAEETIRIALEA